MGLGGSKSLVTLTSLSRQITRIAENSVQDCVQNVSQNQTENVYNSGWMLGGSQTAGESSSINAKCFQDSRKQTNLQNKILDAILQESTGKGTGFLSAFGATKSAAKANLQAKIESEVTLSNIQREYSTIRGSQTVNFRNTGIFGYDSIDLQDGSKAFAAATLKQVENTGILSSISRWEDQHSSAKTSSPLDFISKIFQGAAKEILYAVLGFALVVLIILVLVVGLFKSGGQKVVYLPRENVQQPDSGTANAI